MERLINDAIFTNRIFLIVGIVIIILGSILGGFIFLTIKDLEFTIPFSIFIIIISIICGIYVLRMGRSKTNEMKVKKVEGKVNIIKEESYSGTTKRWGDYYELHIGKKTFDIESDLADIMAQGDKFAIYYIEKSNDIMSVEKI
jgi:flagellar motor component MotA